MVIETTWGSATDIGTTRAVNEDAVLTRVPVFLVADGMGGHARGDVASRIVVAEFDRLAARSTRSPREVLGPQDVTSAIRRCEQRIRSVVTDEDGPPSHSAGSTVSGVVLTEQDGAPFWLVFNVGDSRTYRYTGSRLEQVSVDHSLVQELVDNGTIRPDEARRHPRRNVITRAVGTGPEAEPDFWMLRAAPGDTLLVCSDGLTTELDDEVLAEVLAGAPDPQEAAQRLVSLAVHAGAQDNVSAVVVTAGSQGWSAGDTGPGRTSPRPPREDDHGE